MKVSLVCIAGGSCCVDVLLPVCCRSARKSLDLDLTLHSLKEMPNQCR